MMRFFIIAVSTCIFALSYCQAQTLTNPAPKKAIVIPAPSAVKSSPAYAEVLLLRTEREAELEELLLSYTEEYLRIKELRFELDLIKQEMDRVLAVSALEADRLTLALGKLIVRKIEIHKHLWKLRQQYNNDHPEVKRHRRKIEVFEKAIKEIIP